MMVLDTDKVDDLATFARAHISSYDIDPAYPVIAHIQQELGLEGEAALAATLQYVAYYNLASAVQVWIEPKSREHLSLPCGTERRGHRSPAKLAHHLVSLEDAVELHNDSYREWLLAAGPRWSDIERQVKGVWGNGRWAAYKTCELLQQVHRWPIKAPDMGNEGSSGPVKGLIDIYGDLPTVALQDEAALDLKLRLTIAHSLDIDWSQLETVLCDYHSMVSGHYYVGHDIDQMLEDISRVRLDVQKLVLDARKATLPHEYLLELTDEPWCVDRRRNYAYATSGTVLTR